MVYDQAQSPRLGQRVPIESTYVQMVDDENLMESAYPGQLIYQTSTQMLLVWDDEHVNPDGSKGIWLEVVGGTAGLLTFVGPGADSGAIPAVTPPTSGNTGDLWFATDPVRYELDTSGDPVLDSDGNPVVVYPGGLHQQYRATGPGANSIDPSQPTYWEAVQDGSIVPIGNQAQGNTNSISDLYTQLFGTNTSLAAAEDNIAMVAMMHTFDTVEPTAADERMEGSFWFVTSDDGTEFTEMWNVVDGKWNQTVWDEDTLGFRDATKITTGVLDGSLIAPNSIERSMMDADTVQAVEALTAGDLVNIYDTGTYFGVRRASAAIGSGFPAHGFVLDDCALGGMVHVYSSGFNDQIKTVLAPGVQFLSVNAGQCDESPPQAVGCLVQRVGFATSQFKLNFGISVQVLIT